MRTTLFIMLLHCCITAAGQDFLYTRDSAVVKEINLPSGPLKIERAENRYTGGSCIYLLSDNDVYSYFGYDSLVRYRDFNFADYHILGEKKCRQCMLYCHHEDGNKSCHRNRCNYEWVWVMRKNSTAFTTVPIINPSLPSPAGAGDKDIIWLRDTIIHPVSPADSGITRWQTTGHGDCHGWFTYDLLKDNFHPVLLLKEWSHYGGCRAAGFRNVSINFKTVPGILYYRKNTILVDRN